MSTWGRVLPACALFLAACGQPRADSDGGGFLVITIDGLRADHVAHLGYDRPTTPTLDRLAAEGVSFANAFASSPKLLPAHIAMLTGCEPYVARRRFPAEIEAPDEKRWKVPDLVPRLAVELLSSGYRTAAFVNHAKLAPVYGLQPGFQDYVVSSGPTGRGASSGERPLTERFLQWLRRVGEDEPWFAYLHFNDLEQIGSSPDPVWDRYFDERPGLDEVPPVASNDSVCFAIPRSRWRGASLSLGEYEAIYDGHLRRVDAEIDRLLGSLEVSGRYGNTTVIVLGTHGIQFGEAGLYLSSGFYSIPDLHVPWIVRLGERVDRVGPRQGLVVEQLASQVDLAPTLLELAGLDVPEGMHGYSQLDALTGLDQGRPPREMAFATCGLYEGCTLIGERWCLEYITRDKVVDRRLNLSWFGAVERQGEGMETADRRLRFYNWQEDPTPTLSYVDDRHPLFARYKSRAKSWFLRIRRTRELLQDPELMQASEEEESLRELQQLGYISEETGWPPR